MIYVYVLFPVGENAFCFAIWLTRFSAPTVVWMANRDPVDGTGSQLSLSKDGKLRLTNSAGITVCATRTAASTPLASSKLQLQLQNTGNLVLNHSQSGLFFDNDNVLRLLYQGPVVSSLYWPDPELSDLGHAGRSMYNSTTDFDVKTQRRITLDCDGNLRLYSLEAMNDGPNSVCSYDHASGRRCSFLQGFKIKDLTDWSFGCEAEFNLPSNQKFLPNVTLQHCENECLRMCGCKGFQFVFKADYGGYLCYPKYELFNGQLTPNFGGDLYLRVPKVGFVYNKTLDAAESWLDCTVELSKPVRGTYENKTLKLLLWFTTVVGGLEVTCIFLVFFSLFMSSKNSDPVVEGHLPMSRFKRFKFSELKKATRGFIEVIGRGGGGRVAAIKRLDEANQGEAEFLTEVEKFDGRINFGLWQIQVKDVLIQSGLHKALKDRPTPEVSTGTSVTGEGSRFKMSDENWEDLDLRTASAIRLCLAKNVLANVHGISTAKEFWKKLEEFYQTKGVSNRVYLKEQFHTLRMSEGYCVEGKHGLVVYVYMEHGSLADKLTFNELDCKKRFDIAVGTAKRLACLHEECLEWVLHCDVKPHNILLHSNYQPKVPDLGLSKLLNRGERDHSSFSKMRGTRGYMAPEWVYNRPITSKVDVYSYGIVVLEMVTGKSPTGTQHSSGTGGLAKEYNRLDSLVREKIMMHADDPSMGGRYDSAKMELLLKVAWQCVAEDKDDRPTMTQVVEMLPCDEVN
ncbi:hypothetical protein I3843_08G145100 [Carya illinoinensis]|nr:hypothetical protein I3843_08G145100 [Carya illinoinensis]